LSRKDQDRLRLKTSLPEKMSSLDVHIICKTDGLCESAFDGGPQNPRGVATYGFFICDEEGRPIAKDSGVVGEGGGMDHMVAEYEAVIQALRYLIREGRTKELVIVQNDNQQLILEMKGEKKIGRGSYETKYNEAKKLSSMFAEIRYKQITGESNWEADCLSWKEHRRYVSERNRLI